MTGVVKVCHLLDNVRPGVGVTEVIYCLMTDERVKSTGLVIGTGDIDLRFVQAMRDGTMTEARSPWAAARLLLKHRANGYRILHVHSRKAVSLCLLARALGYAVIRTQHFGTTGAAPAGRVRDLPRRVRNALTFKSGWINHWVAVSETSRQYLRGRWDVPAGRCSIIFNGVDADFVAPLAAEERLRARLAAGWKPGDTVLISVGALVERKRHAALIDVFAALVEGAPDARLAIVGEGSERDRLANQIKRLALCDRVDLLGLRHDVPTLLGASDIYVHMAIDEAFGLAVVEAMAAGLPAIAVAGMGPAEIVENGSAGMVVPPRDAVAMTAAMRELVKDSGLRRSMGAQARSAAISRFSHDAMRKSYRILYLQFCPVQSPEVLSDDS